MAVSRTFLIMIELQCGRKMIKYYADFATCACDDAPSLDGHFILVKRMETTRYCNDIVTRLWLPLKPALTDFRGLTNLICYRRNSVIANMRNKRKLGLTIIMWKRRNSVKSRSVRARLNCTCISFLPLYLV